MEYDRKEIIKEVISEVKITYPGSIGGQMGAIPAGRVRLRSEELDVTIELSPHRSLIENKRLGLTIMELIAEEIIK